MRGKCKAQKAALCRSSSSTIDKTDIHAHNIHVAFEREEPLDQIKGRAIQLVHNVGYTVGLETNVACLTSHRFLCRTIDSRKKRKKGGCLHRLS